MDFFFFFGGQGWGTQTCSPQHLGFLILYKNIFKKLRALFISPEALWAPSLWSVSLLMDARHFPAASVSSALCPGQAAHILVCCAAGPSPTMRGASPESLSPVCWRRQETQNLSCFMVSKHTELILAVEGRRWRQALRQQKNTRKKFGSVKDCGPLSKQISTKH